MWFTDTIDDLNGVSITLRQIASYGHTHGYNLTLVSCANSEKLKSPLPPNTLNFEPIKEINTPGYESQTIAFPSLLDLIRQFVEQQPDQVIISTPGPLGIGAMLCAKIMDIPIKTVYHTDFAEQTMRITKEPSLARAIDFAVNTFYQQSDLIFVPSQFYIDKLKRSGLESNKLSIFPRGLDLEVYSPKPSSRITECSTEKHSSLQGSFTLLFAGRVSEDKNLSFLQNLFEHISREHPGQYNLVIAGDGPARERFTSDLADMKNILFTGRLNPEDLVEWYRTADVLIFPSHTDTFGMVVLEAQACGLPCIVSATGGPKEIILADKTGVVMQYDDCADWLAAIEQYRLTKEFDIDQWNKLRRSCAAHVHKQKSWQPVFDVVLGKACLLPHAQPNDIPESTNYINAA